MRKLLKEKEPVTFNMDYRWIIKQTFDFFSVSHLMVKVVKSGLIYTTHN